MGSSCASLAWVVHDPCRSPARFSARYTAVMFNRSRPWRARGPSFGSRAGSRRRGHCDDLQAIASAADARLDPSFEGSSTDTDLVSGDIQGFPAAAATMPMGTALAPAARIDEAGLQAMARRSREHDSGWAADDISPVYAEPAIVRSPLDLLIPAKSDLMVIPRPRRSA